MFAKECEQMAANRAAILKKQEGIIRLLTDCTELDNAIAVEQSEVEVVTKLLRSFIKEMGGRAMTIEETDTRTDALREWFNKAGEKLAKLKAERAERLARSNEINRLMRILSANEVGAGWDVSKWMFLLDKAIVQRDGTIDFTFMDNTMITVGEGGLSEVLYKRSACSRV